MKKRLNNPPALANRNDRRHATRKLEPGTARDIMRTYGVTFEALRSEIPEPGDLPAEPEAPVEPVTM